MDPRYVILIFLCWLTLLLFLLKKGISLGTAILTASVGLAFTLGTGWQSLSADAMAVLKDAQVAQLLGIVLLIFLLSAILRETRRMERISGYLKRSLKDPRLVMIAVPGLVGLIPMPGGAMFTAPITEEMGNEIQVGPEDKVFSNYWFRHCWELAFPLYPGIVLAAGLLKISPLALTWVLLPLAVTAFGSGFALSWSRWKTPEAAVAAACPETGDLPGFWTLWPVLAVIVIALGDVSLIWGLVGVNLALAFAERMDLAGFWRCLRESLNVPIIVLVLAVFLFGRTLNSTGFLSVLSGFLLSQGAPIWAISFFLPFCLGMLTGVTPGFVGTVFPLLIPLWGDQTVYWAQFAYASGLAGVFFSPSHLCLSMTQEYFRSGLRPVLRLLVFPVGMVMWVSFLRLMMGG